MSLLPHRTLHVCHRTAAWWHMQMPAVDMWVQLETVDINYDGHQDVLMVSSTGVSNSECIHEHPEWAAQWLSMGQSWTATAFAYMPLTPQQSPCTTGLGTATPTGVV